MYIWPFRRPETVLATATTSKTDASVMPSIEKQASLSSPYHPFDSAMPSIKQHAFYSSSKDGDLPRPVVSGKASSGSSYYPFAGRAPRRSRALAAILFIGLFMMWAFYPALSTLVYRPGIPSRLDRQPYGSLPAKQQQNLDASQVIIPAKEAPKEKKLVPLEAHIMSKCPDAQDCLVDLVVPAMQQTSQMVNWTLSFIGDVDKDEGVHCKHGPEECLGNIMMLCAAKLYPDPKISLGFSTCLIRDYEEIPSRSLIESCALEHAVDFGRLNGCASEEGDGLDLLKASVRRSKAQNIKYSCTVRLNEKIRCIRDDGTWVNCDDGSEPGDLIRDINLLYEKS